MKSIILKYSTIIGIGFVVCIIDVLASRFIRDNTMHSLFAVVLAQYIYKDLRRKMDLDSDKEQTSI